MLFYLRRFLVARGVPLLPLHVTHTRVQHSRRDCLHIVASTLSLSEFTPKRKCSTTRSSLSEDTNADVFRQKRVVILPTCFAAWRARAINVIRKRGVRESAKHSNFSRRAIRRLLASAIFILDNFVYYVRLQALGRENRSPLRIIAIFSLLQIIAIFSPCPAARLARFVYRSAIPPSHDSTKFAAKYIVASISSNRSRAPQFHNRRQSHAAHPRHT